MSKAKLSLIAIVMLPVGMFLNGYTLSVLWAWFIVTKFGMPSLSVAEALGLVIVIRYFTFKLPDLTAPSEDENDKPYEDKNDKMINRKKLLRITLLPFMKAAVFIGLGWIIQHFI